jgi:hypothetical protein
LRWRIDKKYESLFKGFLETSLRPVPPHDIIFPTKRPTCCNIWAKEILINEEDEKRGELEWSYRHECGHLAAFPRTVGEDFKNYVRAKDIIISIGYDARPFTKYYPLVANIAYDLIIDTELIMNYPSVREQAERFLRRARGLPEIFKKAFAYAIEGRSLPCIKPEAPHETIVYVYSELYDMLKQEDEKAIAAFIGLGGPSLPCTSSAGDAGSAGAQMMGSGDSSGDSSSGGSGGEQGPSPGGSGDGRGREGREGSEREGRGGGKGGTEDREDKGRKDEKDEAGGGGADKAERGGRGPSPEGSGQGRGEEQEGKQGGGRGEGQGGNRWSRPLDLEYGPVSHVDLLPTVAELIEGRGDIDYIVEAVVEYVESVSAWRQAGRGSKGQPSNGAGFGRGPIDVPTLKELVLDAYVERCFSLPLQVLPRREGFVGVLPRERSTVWRLGDPIDELDIRETVRSYGVLVPGHTTVRTREVPVLQKVGRLREGGADIVIIVDQSGSMGALMPSSNVRTITPSTRVLVQGEEKWIAARNTALALLGWARYIKANARLMTFSDAVVIDSGWVDARKVKEVAMHFALHYRPLNNTVLSEALARIDRPKATVYIIGDFALGDWNWVGKVLPRLASLDVLLVLLLIGDELDVKRMAEMARGCGVEVKAYAVDSPRAMLENALRELKI